jgi:hypothetical protein
MRANADHREMESQTYEGGSPAKDDGKQGLS